VGDCFVSSDVASALGDAYFAIGEFDRARDMYSEAKRLFDLPKYVNLHAQEGRLGM
jgi:tetratricopeptide (TPR) repeat protein